jgi:hypothetical protein
MWFEALFGFPEADWETTRSRFVLDGTTLRSRVNGRSFEVGRFSTPSLGALRARGRAVGERGATRVEHVAVGDALELHALPENRGALFQVASQHNCLEFVGPSVVPEDGVTRYASDPTQGPACALAAAAGTVYRTYFAPVGGGEGQRRDRQIDTLQDLAAALGPPGRFFEVHNGYTRSDPARLRALDAALAAQDREELRGRVRIGWQRGVGVDFARRWVQPATPTTVSQAFCAAVSCAYVPEVPTDAWAGLATLVLDAAYEATLWAAVVDAAEGQGTGRVWLTFLGGGAFGNRPAWITGAMRRALAAVDGYALEVCVAHHRRVDPRLREAVEAR